MNFKHINYVLTILNEGSITAASKKLFVSQPALSQTIKLIEQDLGAPIFDRTTDPISLTFAGQRYVEAAQAMLDIDRNLRAEIAETKKRCMDACASAFPASAASSSSRSSFLNSSSVIRLSKSTSSSTAAIRSNA